MTFDLPEGEAHVWHVDLDVAPDTGASLDSEERARAAGFRSATDRRRYVASHSALRTLLASYAGTSPEGIHYARGPYGKPTITSHSHVSDVRFSLAHSGRTGLVAVARGQDVGVDVEGVLPWAAVMPLVGMVCAPVEQEVLAKSPSRQRAERFTELWVRKEALLKAEGVGLAVSPSQITVLWPDHGSCRSTYEDPDGRTWSLRTVPVREGHRAAVAVAETARVKHALYGAAAQAAERGERRADSMVEDLA